jgi:hypothetical protein
MKKLVMLLAVLIATPVFALTISMTDNGDGTVTVGYSGGDTQNPLRAVALEFSLDKGAIVSAVTDYKEDGENESGDAQAFGIYPARIIVELDGTVIPGNYGTPEADLLDPGAGNGSSVKVLEFGSLYVDDSNKPGVSGLLCKLTIDCNGATDPNLTMVDEDVYRGGVLLEDGTLVPVDQTITLTDCVGVQECMKTSHPDYDEWDALGKPDSWCYEYQCEGDADGLAQFGFQVLSDDLNILAGAYGQAVTSDPNLGADFDHAAQFGFRVLSDDLNILAGNYGQAVSSCEPTHFTFYVIP